MDRAMILTLHYKIKHFLCSWVESIAAECTGDGGTCTPQVHSHPDPPRPTIPTVHKEANIGGKTAIMCLSAATDGVFKLHTNLVIFRLRVRVLQKGCESLCGVLKLEWPY